MKNALTSYCQILEVVQGQSSIWVTAWDLAHARRRMLSCKLGNSIMPGQLVTLDFGKNGQGVLRHLLQQDLPPGLVPIVAVVSEKSDKDMQEISIKIFENMQK
jgi:hypothetical protein